jgi:amidohydrolase
VSTGPLLSLVDALFDEMVDVRRAVHAKPELSDEEHATTTLVCTSLGALGLKALPCPTPTGAVYELDTGRPGRTVLLRADIDALPLDEDVDVPFRSRVEGVMHACGHDAHTAILLGVAKVLHREPGDLVGRFVFLFQPAEELGGGAKRMIDGGVLDAIKPDRVLGVHVVSMMPTGIVAARPGIAMAAADVWKVRLTGAGGHGALSGDKGNVVVAASALTQALPATTRGLEYEGVPCACSTGKLSAGTAVNVVPRFARLEGTLRTFSEEHRAEILGRMREACAKVAKSYYVAIELELGLHVPSVDNDPDVTAVVHRATSAVLGENAVVAPPPVAPSDDVSELLRRAPGCHVFIGAAPQRDGPPPMHHAPDFEIDERSLRIGAVTLAASAIELARGG